MDHVRWITFGEYGATYIHPLVIGFLACMTALAFAPRRSAVMLAVLGVCVFVPADQRIVIGGLDFTVLRLITIVAWIRVLIRGEYRGLSFNSLDRVFVLWVLSASLFYLLRVGPSGIAYRLGASFDALPIFFLARVLVRSRADVLLLWRQLAWIALVLSPFFIYEATKGQNVFGVFNSDGSMEAMVREGSVRARGPFSHPILAGTFGAVVTAVFIGIFLGQKKDRRLFGTAIVGATIITSASSSSGPLFAWLVGAVGWMMWWIRGRMRVVLWGAAGLAVLLHLIRERPVWHLIFRLSSITGGGGYHRYKLIDEFVNRFSEWALIGTDNTAYWGWGLQDTTNQYVAEGITGGLITLVLFIVLLRRSFVRLRLTRNVSERLEGPTSLWALLTWGCSVSLAVHCVSFVSVSYFGQMRGFFFLFLAIIPALAKFKGKRVMAPAARNKRTQAGFRRHRSPTLAAGRSNTAT